MCLYPKLIKNRKYIKNKKNGGNVPAVKDERVKLVPVGCGKCMECRKKKSRDWQVRLQEELKQNNNGKFITLTFSNESIKKIICEQNLTNLKGYELDNAIATKATRLFLERWRKKHKKSLRHWLVTELGHNGTENIHMHGIIWTNESMKEIEKIWSYGFMWMGKGEKKENFVNTKTVNYIIKYIHKVDQDHKNYTSKILASPGIGDGYTKKGESKKKNGYSQEGNTDESYRTSSGHKVALPIYYRNKIYTEDEREKLWLEKLDKNIRYVCGEKVKADDTEEYYKLLEWHREMNKKLGYGDDTKSWDQIEYEQERRKLLLEKRIGKLDATSKYIPKHKRKRVSSGPTGPDTPG